jgi:7-cyano-7-deazaguanine synthase
MIFLTIGIGLAESLGANSVCYGAHLTDSHGYWDCTPDFVSRFNDLLNLQRRNRVKVRAPFVYKRKAEILKIGLSLDIDYSRTWSCYAGGDQPCGKCSTCVERGQAFAELGVEEPIYQGPVDDDLEVFNGQ